MSRISLDASILVYGVDTADSVRQKAAKRIVKLAARRDCVLVLQALAEFYYVVTRKGKLDAAEARTKLSHLRSVFPVALPGATALDDAMSIAERYGINFWDAMLIGVARDAGATVLLSEDLQDGQEYGGLRCINPFARSTPALAKLLNH